MPALARKFTIKEYCDCYSRGEGSGFTMDRSKVLFVHTSCGLPTEAYAKAMEKAKCLASKEA